MHESTKDQTPPLSGSESLSAETPVVKDAKPVKLLIGALVVLIVAIGVIGFLVIKKAFAPASNRSLNEEKQEEVLPEVDASIQVSVTWSKAKENSVLLVVRGLGGKYTSIGYELQYETGGVGKGVTSGSKPIDVTGLDMFEREIYLGTCSKNVCKPDLGVKKVAVVLEFTDKDAKKSQFSKEFEL